MTRRFMITLFAAVVTLHVAAASAHEDFRIIGVIAKVTARAIDVTQKKDGKTISIVTNEKTAVTRDKKPVDRAELKAGLNVVVDARGDDIADLEAVEVRLVAAPAAK
jgi:hypothetical protein